MICGVSFLLVLLLTCHWSHAWMLRVPSFLGPRDRIIMPWRGEDGKNINNNNKYYYFAYGSNMLPETMQALRGIQPLDATAAVLPGYKLRFNIGTTTPTNNNEGPNLVQFLLSEPSAACVEAVSDGDNTTTSNTNNKDTHYGSTSATGDGVHGVLYTLTRNDFRTVARTEGVPFVYQWKDVKVVPYVGNGQSAGSEAMMKPSSLSSASNPTSAGIISTHDDIIDRTGEANNKTKVACQTLIAARGNSNNDVPPSPSYLRILQEGAAYWRMDMSYRKDVLSNEANKVGEQKLLVRGGLSGPLLYAAMCLNPINPKLQRKNEIN